MMGYGGSGGGPFRILTDPDARRWRLAWVLMVTLFIGFLDRVNISLALPLIAEEYGWSDAELKSNGEVLFSLFYVGYGLANIFLSPWAARLGARVSLLLIVVLWSLFTSLGAVASQFLLAFIATRILLGVAEGVHFPMMNTLTRAWFPPAERGRANSIWISGLYLAILLSPVVLTPLMQTFGWRVGFWGLGLVGLLVTFPLVLFTVRDRPDRSDGVSEREFDTIRAGLAAEDAMHEAASERPRFVLARLASNPAFLLLALSGVLNNLVGLGFASWLPSFFVRTKGLAYEDLTWAASVPFLGALVGVALWSNLGDRTTARALIAAVGYLGTACAIVVVLVSPSITIVLLFFTLAVFFSSSYASAEFALLQRALPATNIAGDVGIYNGLTMLIGGGLGPLVVSSIVGDPETVTAPSTLLILPGICFVIATVMLLVHRRMRF